MASQSSPASVHRLQLPLGIPGVRAKLALIGHLAAVASRDPRLRASAVGICRRAGARAPAARAAALHRWVRRRVVYIREPIETFTDPARMVREKRWRFGDCDDHTGALEALARGIGLQTRRVGVGWDGHYRHVYPEIQIGGRWIPADTTVPYPLGWDPLAHIARRRRGIVWMRAR